MSFKFGNIKQSSLTEYDSFTKEQITIKALQLLTSQGLLKLANRSISTGDNLCHCPFHKDNTPSMSINTGIGYHCFSCGDSGSIYKLYRELTGMSLSKELGLQTQSDQFSRFSQKDLYIPTPEDFEQLPIDGTLQLSGELFDIDDHPEGIKYLRKRCIPFDIAKQLGFKYTDKCLIISEKSTGEKFLTEYTNRVIVPIYEKGVLISLEGRDVTGYSNRKVLFPKNSSVNTLYDIDNLDFNKTLYVVEGLMDLAILRTDPYFTNSTCIFSNIPSKRQLYWLNKFESIIAIPDNDGRPGERTIEILEKGLFKSFKVLPMPALQYTTSDGQLSRVKDIGDIPTKLQCSVKHLRERKWLDSVYRVRSKAFEENLNMIK